MPELLAGYTESLSKNGRDGDIETEYIQDVINTIETSQLEVRKILSRINAFVLDD